MGITRQWSPPGRCMGEWLMEFLYEYYKEKKKLNLTFNDDPKDDQEKRKEEKWKQPTSTLEMLVNTFSQVDEELISVGKQLQEHNGQQLSRYLELLLKVFENLPNDHLISQDEFEKTLKDEGLVQSFPYDIATLPMLNCLMFTFGFHNPDESMVEDMIGVRLGKYARRAFESVICSECISQLTGEKLKIIKKKQQEVELALPPLVDSCSQVTFLGLPDELLEEILSYLPFPVYLLRLSLVNRKLYNFLHYETDFVWVTHLILLSNYYKCERMPEWIYGDLDESKKNNDYEISQTRYTLPEMIECMSKTCKQFNKIQNLEQVIPYFNSQQVTNMIGGKNLVPYHKIISFLEYYYLLSILQHKPCLTKFSIPLWSHEEFFMALYFVLQSYNSLKPIKEIVFEVTQNIEPTNVSLELFKLLVKNKKVNVDHSTKIVIKYQDGKALLDPSFFLEDSTDELYPHIKVLNNIMIGRNNLEHLKKFKPHVFNNIRFSTNLYNDLKIEDIPLLSQLSTPEATWIVNPSRDSENTQIVLLNSKLLHLQENATHTGNLHNREKCNLEELLIKFDSNIHPKIYDTSTTKLKMLSEFVTLEHASVFSTLSMLRISVFAQTSIVESLEWLSALNPPISTLRFSIESNPTSPLFQSITQNTLLWKESIEEFHLICTNLEQDHVQFVESLCDSLCQNCSQLKSLFVFYTTLRSQVIQKVVDPILASLQSKYPSINIF